MSPFSFEKDEYTRNNVVVFLGMITSTIHSTRRHAHEIHNNLNLLRLACIELDRATFNTDLKQFINGVQSSKRSILSPLIHGKDSVCFRMKDENTMALADIRSLLPQTDIELYKSCYVSTARFTKIMYRTTRQSNDSCILFTLAGKLSIGFIVNII